MSKRDKVLYQLKRAQYFLSVAKRLRDPSERWAVLIGAAYFACSIADQLLTLADQGYITNERSALKEQLAHTLPHYELLDLIRIHDFHRCTLVPLNATSTALHTEIHVKAIGSGTAAVLVPGAGNEPMSTSRSGQGSKVKTGRPLEQRGTSFRLQGDSNFVELEVAVSELLAVGQKAVDQHLPASEAR